jgi:hypothetical protein
MSEAIKHSLQPCPFCGKTHTLIVGAASETWEADEHGPYPHTETYAVFCDASSEGRKGGCGGSGGYFATKEDAIEAWNRRNDPLVERVKELEEALRAILVAADTPLAQGGEMWFAEAVAPPIDEARAALSKALPNTVVETPK